MRYKNFLATEENFGKDMNIVTCCDENYLKYVPVLFSSFIQNHPNINFIFHIFMLDNGINEKVEEYKNNINQSINHCVFYDIPKEILSPIENALNGNYMHVTIETWLRHCIVDYLPNDIDRCLYLDVDFLCVSDIRPYYFMNFGNNFFAQSTIHSDIYNNRQDIMTNNGKLVIEFDVDTFVYRPVSGAGLVLLNLKLLRENNINFDFIKNLVVKYPKILFQDATIYNNVFREVIIYLNGKNSSLEEGYNAGHDAINFWYREFEDEFIDNQKLVHFSFSHKPWLFIYDDSFKQFIDFIKLTKFFELFKFKQFRFYKKWWEYASLCENFNQLEQEAQLRTQALKFINKDLYGIQKFYKKI